MLWLLFCYIEADHLSQVAQDESAAGEGHGAPAIVALEDLGLIEEFEVLGVGLDHGQSAGVVHGEKNAIGNHVRADAVGVFGAAGPDEMSVEVHASHLSVRADADDVVLVKNGSLLIGAEEFWLEAEDFFGDDFFVLFVQADHHATGVVTAGEKDAVWCDKDGCGNGGDADFPGFGLPEDLAGLGRDAGDATAATIDVSFLVIEFHRHD